MIGAAVEGFGFAPGSGDAAAEPAVRPIAIRSRTPRAVVRRLWMEGLPQRPVRARRPAPYQGLRPMADSPPVVRVPADEDRRLRETGAGRLRGPADRLGDEAPRPLRRRRPQRLRRER